MSDEFILRRRFHRVQVDIWIEYRPQHAAEGAKIRKEKILTIGEGGIFLQTKLTYPKETKLDAVFELEERQIKCILSVRHSIPYSHTAGAVQFPGMGVNFARIDEESVRFIRRFVARKRLEAVLGDAKPAMD